MLITSRRHPLCQRVRALHLPRGRREARQILIEGENAVTAALETAWPMEVILSEPTETSLRDRAAAAGVDWREIHPEVLASISDAATSPRLVAIGLAAPPEPPATDLKGLCLLLDGISDPGNVGTLIRAADAAGAAGCLLSPGSADPWSPKVIRSSAGSIFHLPVQRWESEPDLAQWLDASAFPLLAAEARSGQDCFHYAWPRNAVLMVGHETRGISARLLERAHERVTIPLYGRAESLNAAMAGTILLFAWRNSCYIP